MNKKQKYKEIFKANWNAVVTGIIAGLIVAILLPNVNTLTDMAILNRSIIGAVIFIVAYILVSIYSFFVYSFEKNKK